MLLFFFFYINLEKKCFIYYSNRTLKLVDFKCPQTTRKKKNPLEYSSEFNHILKTFMDDSGKRKSKFTAEISTISRLLICRCIRLELKLIFNSVFTTPANRLTPKTFVLDFPYHDLLKCTSTSDFQTWKPALRFVRQVSCSASVAQEASLANLSKKRLFTD